MSIDTKALFNICYGLYVLTSHDGKKHNGIIVNTVMQLTDNPQRVAVCINKVNYSHDIVKSTGKMNINCLTESASFDLFKRFGFASGRDTDKFAGIEYNVSSNGMAVLKESVNSYISLTVESYTDVGTHGLFICSIDAAEIITDEPSVTYTYYQKNIKPKPETKKKGFVCKICGYVYEGETLPADYICPLCKHGADDFEEIQ